MNNLNNDMKFQLICEDEICIIFIHYTYYKNWIPKVDIFGKPTSTGTGRQHDGS